MQLLSNNDKISTYTYIRQQTRKEFKDTRSSFPPVAATLLKEGFSTQDYRDQTFKNLGSDVVNGVFFAPGTAHTQVRDKDKIFPLDHIDLDQISTQQ